MKVAIARIALLLIFVLPCFRSAAGENLDHLDAVALAHLEDKASHAAPRDQSFLYTELVHVYSELAGQQLTDGDTDKAQATFQKIQLCLTHIQTGLLANAKKLKNAEMLLQACTFRMSQLAHRVSSEDQPTVEATLQQLNKVHDQMLAQVFAH